MELVNAWTGRAACALQSALRLTNEAFADHLGVAVRTVATWHQRPDVIPKADVQQALDTALERASEASRTRFARLMSQHSVQPPANPTTAQALRVAIAVVINDPQVLIVCRRGDDGGGISWQFPAGMVKPGVPPETVAVRETLAETGIHCSVVRNLGSRLHPITHVFCEYLLCEYLTGDAENIDIVENVSVLWIDKTRLTRFIPAEHIFPPILEALEVPSDSADS
jgi:8-oxo-dGTP pyrophosphatase MutT (NUDIX family)